MVVYLDVCSASHLSWRFSCSLQKELSGKLQRKDFMVLIDSGAIGAGALSLLFALTDRMYYNKAFSMTPIQIRVLSFISHSVSFTLFTAPYLYLLYLVVSSLILYFLSLPVSPADRTAAELLQKRSIVRYGTAS